MASLCKLVEFQLNSGSNGGNIRGVGPGYPMVMAGKDLLFPPSHHVHFSIGSTRKLQAWVVLWVSHAYFLDSDRRIIPSFIDHLDVTCEKTFLLYREAESFFGLKYIWCHRHHSMSPRATIQDPYFPSGSIRKAFPAVRHTHCRRSARRIMCSPLGYLCQNCEL